ncbi:head-tail adaptor [Rhizobium sp. BK316]|uniref:head-tail adaptor protein n=1 Tax=Rhizobium sp. BK316 TaxID=2587053 RepID=UPI001621E624|nr:head-tail adaptor protein [Rhizobium sp. BK316]MBB3410663.1 head-tail adaptor [Rhizobium sp. BK316]
MTINPGKMRDRITLQKRGVPTWDDPEPFVDVGTVWAQFLPTRGREFREGGVAIGETRAVFSINYREDLSQVDRLVHLGRGGNRVWNVQDVVPVGFKDGTEIHATATDVGAN